MNSKKLTLIITGASRGLGKAIWEGLLSTNYNFVLVSRNARNIVLPKSIDSDRVLLVSADVTKDQDVDHIISATLSRFGKIDVLINNAGIFRHVEIDKSKLSDIDAVFATNIRGLYLLSRAVVPHLKKQKSGLIINIGSKIARRTNLEAGRTLYATSKHAVQGFSLALQKELQKYHIRVSCLEPATLNTFTSFSSRKFIKTTHMAKIINLIIDLDQINFDNLIFQSINQYL